MAQSIGHILLFFFVLKSTILSNLHCKEAELVPAVSQNSEAILKATFITPESVASAQKPSKHKTLFENC